MENISRRKALEKISVMIGGMLNSSLWIGVLSGCEAPTNEDWIPKFLTKKEAVTSANFVDILIPSTDTPGAKEAMVHRFIDEMLNGYFNKDEQQAVRNGLKNLQNQKFDDLNIDKRVNIVSNLAQQSDNSFFKTMRSMSLLGFFTSEIGATQCLNHDPIPGEYEGCIPINKYGGKTWSMS